MEIILLVVMLFLSAFLVAAETALSSLKKIHMKGNETSKSQKDTEELLNIWLKNPNELLTTLLLCKTIAYLLLIGTMLRISKDIYKIYELNMSKNIYYSIAFALICTVVVLFVELFSRAIAKSKVYSISKFTIVPLNTLRIILRPLILIFIQVSKGMMKLFKINTSSQIFKITEDDIITYIKEGTESGAIEEGEEEMLHSIFEFSDTAVKEILTPRRDIFAIEAENELGEVIDEIFEQEFSRIPIYSETIDKIVGIVHIKDLLEYIKDQKLHLKMKDLMKDVYFVPATKTLLELLEEFREKQSHMAVIIDEYGGTVGIVTIEDLLEEIVGEIRDEFDQEEENIQQVTDKIYDLKGDTLIEEINSELSVNIPLSEEYDTISGYFQDKLGKVAEISDHITGEGYILKVMEVDNMRVEKIRIVITGKDNEENEDGRD